MKGVTSIIWLNGRIIGTAIIATIFPIATDSRMRNGLRTRRS